MILPRKMELFGWDLVLVCIRNSGVTKNNVALLSLAKLHDMGMARLSHQLGTRLDLRRV